MIRANLKREYMAKLWSTEDLLGQDEREIQYLLRLYRRGIITKNLSKVKKLPPCVA